MNIRKKILFLVTQSEFGGAQRFIYSLTTNLNKEKYDILVGAGLEGDNENGLLNLLEKKGIQTKRLKYIKRGVNPFFDFCLGLIEVYRLLKKEKPDILFLCSSKAGAMGSLIGRLMKVPKIIYRIGGWTFNDPRNFLINLYFKFIERFSAKWKDYIINNAEFDKQRAIKLGIKPRKEIRVIHNGIDIDKLEFFPRKQTEQEVVVGTIANDYPTKGLRYLREAEKKLIGVKFVILSGIPNAYKYLKTFDIFVLPSVKEGFPWVVLEAMAAGIPVIATKVGAIPEIIQNNENGIIIEPGNPDAIIEAIKKILSNDNLRKKIVENGKKTVVEKFNLEKMLKQYEHLFSDN